MTDFVYSPDYSQVLVPKQVNVNATSIFLLNEIEALLDWVANCTISTQEEKKKFNKVIKMHFSNAKAFLDNQSGQDKTFEQLLKYAELPQSKIKQSVNVLKKLAAGEWAPLVNGDRYLRDNISYFGFAKPDTLKIITHLAHAKIDDNTKTQSTNIVLAMAKKQKNFISSAKKIEDMLSAFILANKSNSNKAIIHYTLKKQDNISSGYNHKYFEVNVEIQSILSSLVAFNQSIHKLLQARTPGLISGNLEDYHIKKWTGSFENHETFKAKEAFYLLATSDQKEGFIGFKEPAHNGLKLGSPCIVHDINSAYIFHTIPKCLSNDFENIHKINVKVDFTQVVKTAKAKDLAIAGRIQAFIEKNKLEESMKSSKETSAQKKELVQKKKLNKI